MRRGDTVLSGVSEGATGFKKGPGEGVPAGGGSGGQEESTRLLKGLALRTLAGELQSLGQWFSQNGWKEGRHLLSLSEEVAAVVPEQSPRSLTAGAERGLLSQQSGGCSAESRILTEALSGELAAEHERAERLARGLRTESTKRQQAQDKGRRLLAERLQLQVEVAGLKVKRRRTAALLRAMRATLKEERQAAGSHFLAHQCLGVEFRELQREAELMLVQATNAALHLAKLANRNTVLATQLTALQQVHAEYRGRTTGEKLGLELALAAAEEATAQARAEAVKEHEAAVATAEAYGNLQRELEAVEGERTRLSVQLEAQAEDTERAISAAEEAQAEAKDLRSQVAVLQAEVCS